MKMSRADRWADLDDTPASRDREESREAARFDPTTYVRIGGQWYDEDRVPALSDLE